MFSCDSLIKTVDELVDSFTSDGGGFSTRNMIKAKLKKMRLSSRVKSFRIEESSDHPDRTKQIVDSLSKIVDQLIVVDAFDQEATNMVSMVQYSISPFEWRRSRACSEGISKRANECKIEQLLNDAFNTLFFWSDRVYLIDYSLGANWKNRDGERNRNYAAAIPYWCSFFSSFEREIIIIIRTLAPIDFEYGGQQRENLIAEIEEYFVSSLQGSNIQVKVEISDKVHSRLLHSCGFFIDIDRGIDICYGNGSVRRTSFGFKYDKTLESELR